MKAMNLRGVCVMSMAAVVAGVLALNVGAADKHIEDTPLEKYMAIVNNNYKKLRTDVRRGNFGDAQLKLVREMQVASVQSMGETPKMTGKKPEAERKLFLIDYKKGMIKLTNTFFDLELAMLNGDKAAVEKIMEDLSKQKSDGHEKFTEQ
jgi:hypothetical protein